MIDASVQKRRARLRRIAAVEIARHREELGYVGAALEGSVASGAVWPTSDVDFTVVPRPEHARERLIEWEGRAALPYSKAAAGKGIRIDVCGQREGIPWHKHLTDAPALRGVIDGYPESFIRPAEGPFDSGLHGFLDGLAVMEVLEDPEGLLAETRAFVAARRFAAAVWVGRRRALLQELRRQLDRAHEAMENGQADAVVPILSGDVGFAAVAARLWLERSRRIVSAKEQDGCLAEAAADAGCPEVHALYRRVLAVDPERTRAAAPLLIHLARRAAALYRRLGSLPPDDPDRRREALVWGAYAAHCAATLGLAPSRGHPAHAYRSLGALRYWTIEYPRRLAAPLLEPGSPACAAVQERLDEVAGLAGRVHTILLDPAAALDRSRTCLDAACRLLTLTEKRL
jgi:hypothetical protein